MSYAAQLAAAVAANDHATVLRLAMLTAGIADRVEERLAGKRRRTAKWRAKKVEVTSPVTPCDVTERHDASPSVTVTPSPSSPPLLPPTPPNNSSPLSPPSTSPPESALHVQLALSSALAGRIDDVKRFLETRRVQTRPEWERQMLKTIGPGSPFTADDLAQACADAVTLDIPLAGPWALRAFVAKARDERLKEVRKPKLYVDHNGDMSPELERLTRPR